MDKCWGGGGDDDSVLRVALDLDASVKRKQNDRRRPEEASAGRRQRRLV